ncbi:hypothetical protein [Actinokineospora sp. NBRC 105648]|uniref:hypothetical protein n=1 Tax=Actinokineospora sp. NBRC 105648 TaxID=3032206 RepID=UPI0024A5836F|nr:hypothetical protein [Actinokineospora sp. NBRC 105648]GLZ42602.1 hypothetical protein Acsp05_62260 [Actinokineospora sp. NBRC 105648]
MRFPRGLAGAAVLAATALALSAAPAFAADGVFSYGEGQQLENPADGECLELAEPAFTYSNNTSSGAVLFENLSCEGATEFVPPGSSGNSSESSASSVLFIAPDNGN